MKPPPSHFSEDQARRLWERAAELQAQAAAREEADAESLEGTADPGGAESGGDSGSGYALEHVRQAALEAGIQAEFLDLALAEEAVLALEGDGEDRPLDRAARRFLGNPDRAIELRRDFDFPADRVWPVLEATLAGDDQKVRPMELQGDPLAGGAVVFEIEYDMTNTGSLGYAAAVTDVRRFLLRFLPREDGDGCTVLAQFAMRHSHRVNFGVGAVVSGITGISGGVAGMFLGAGLVGAAGLAALPAAGLFAGAVGLGLAAGGSGGRALYRKTFRWEERFFLKAFDKVLSRADLTLRREADWAQRVRAGEGPSAIPPPGPRTGDTPPAPPTGGGGG